MTGVSLVDLQIFYWGAIPLHFRVIENVPLWTIAGSLFGAEAARGGEAARWCQATIGSCCSYRRGIAEAGLIDANILKFNHFVVSWILNVITVDRRQ